METMTWVGLDVHARSTHAAALTLPTAELQRARFGAESEAIVAWLQRLPQPVHACYEAGPTGRVYPGKSTWTQAHHRWLAGQCFDNANSELAYLDYLAAVDGLVARRRALDERLSRLAVEGDWWPTVQRLRSFRGLDTLSALVPALEVGDFARFRSPRQLVSWLGLVPSLSQSGESSTQGAITKTGSRYARRLLVEAAWHYGRPPRIGVTLRQRQDGQPAHVLQIAWRCQHRLYRLHQLLSQRHKPGNTVPAPLARSLACSLWAAAVAP